MEQNSPKILENIETLTKRLEEFEKQRRTELGNLTSMMSVLERLESRIEEIESETVAYRKLMNKLDKMSVSLEKIVGTVDNAQVLQQKDSREKIRYYLRLAKLTGKIIEIVAAGAEVTIDNLDKVIPDSVAREKGKENVLDISPIVDSIKDIMQGFSPRSRNESERPQA